MLPEAAVVAHHGGAGTTFAALAHGVPQVIIPQGADNFDHAAMCTRKARSSGRYRTPPPGYRPSRSGDSGNPTVLCYILYQIMNRLSQGKVWRTTGIKLASTIEPDRQKPSQPAPWRFSSNTAHRR